MSLKFIDSLAITIGITLATMLLIRIPRIRKFFVKHQPGWAKKVNNLLTGRKRRTISIKKQSFSGRSNSEYNN